MIGILVVSHGNLANEIVSAARTIVGDIKNIEAVSIGWNDNVEESREKISKALKRINIGKGVLILTDMFGGTPTNISLTFLEKSKVEIVTGVNLPMVIKLCSIGDGELTAIAQEIRIQGQKSIYVASEILNKMKERNVSKQ
jgi:PTS system mannose-specific IIA component